MIKKNIAVALIVVFLSLTVFSYLNFRYTDEKLNTGRPPISITYDNFYHPYYAKIVAETGNPIYLPYSWLAKDNATSIQPPVFYTALAAFANLNKIHPYDLSLIFLILLKIFILFGFFIILKRVFNLQLALIAISFSIAIPPALFFLFNFGYSLDMTAAFFLPAAFFVYLLLIEKSSETGAYLLSAILGLLLSASFQSHAIETAFMVLFLGLSTTYLFLIRRINLSYLKYFAVGAAAFLISLLEFLPIFLLVGYGSNSGFLFKPFPGSEYARLSYHPALPFGVVFSILLGLGILASIFAWKKNWGNPLRLIVISFPIYWLLIAFSYKIGFNANYVYRLIFSFWPLIYVFPAIFLSLVTNLILRNKLWRKICIIFICATIVGVSLVSYKQSAEPYSIYTPELWQTITWVHENTPKNAFIFSLNPYIHEFQMFNERVNAKGDLNIESNIKNIVSLCNRTYPVRFTFDAPVANLRLIERKGYVAFDISKNGSVELANGTLTILNQLPDSSLPIESFDYLVVQYAGIEYAPCIDFFMNETQNRNFSVVWNNEYYLIMQNDKSIKLKH